MRKSLFVLGLVLLAAISCRDDNEPAVPFATQLANDIKAIDNYLIAKNIDAIADESGVRIVLHTNVDGASPDSSSCVIADYKGMLLANDSIFDEGQIYKTSLLNLVTGWQIGVPYMSIGDSATLYVPSGLGYGTRELTKIPKNSNLIFGIKLIRIGELYYNPAIGGYSCYFED